MGENPYENRAPHPHRTDILSHNAGFPTNGGKELP